MRWIFVSILIVWVVVMWVGVIYAIRRGLKPYLENKRQPRIKVEAEITNMHAPHGWTMLDGYSALKLLVQFTCKDGYVRTYDVPENVYRSVELGDKGELEYQGDFFIGFCPYRERVTEDDLYRRLTRI